MGPEAGFLTGIQWVDLYMGNSTTQTIPWPLTGTPLSVVCSHGGTDQINGFVLGIFR